MLFNSLGFLFGFLPLVVAGFFALAAFGARNAAALWVGLASLFFYAFTDPAYLLPIIVVSMAFNFAAGLTLSRRPSRGVLVIAIAANLALLGYFKYAAFLVGTVLAVVPIAIAEPSVRLPIGISFFTFTQIAYLADAYGGKAREYKPQHYLLFVTFFPHLVAGPILHHREMMPQFESPETYRFRLPTFALGLSWFAAGLFKKVVLADSLIETVRAVFATDVSIAPLGLADAWLGTLAYALQIYFDFSGYSDMAIGLALLFGIRLPLNFNSPYQANSMIDFWRRWHMTLSRFLRDYLYIPLGGNRRGPGRRYVNLTITMLLGGLWHGASWNFVIWGGIHGIALAGNHLWRGTSAAARWRMPDALARLVTFTVVLWAWVPFRAGTLRDTVAIWSAMLPVGRGGDFDIQRVSGGSALWICALLLIAWILPNTQTFFSSETLAGDLRMAWPRWRLNWRWALGLGVAFGVALAQILQGQITEFIYFKF